ncbi:hypothetical protein H2248_002093 [Termitomyces sp. 'cryptogamus']|nr:hypothetical protein H2248_002093 [Termitomyces sp. 'cryptogamus']
MLKKIWKSNDKISRHKLPWNTYQGYFSIYGDDELDQCKLESGTAADCFLSFIEEYGPHAEMIMQAALQLKCVSTEKETMQQHTRSFKKHCQKVEKLNQEGIAQHFQSLTIIIGECVNEDASLATITATPGLENPSVMHMTMYVTTHSLKPLTLPNKPPLPQNPPPPPQRFVKLPQYSTPTPANSDGPLANSDVFPTATGASPGLPEPLGPLPAMPDPITHHQLNTLAPLTYPGVSRQPRNGPHHN